MLEWVCIRLLLDPTCARKIRSSGFRSPSWIYEAEKAQRRKLSRSNDGLEREFRFSIGLEGGVCTQRSRKSTLGEREAVAHGASINERITSAASCYLCAIAAGGYIFDSAELYGIPHQANSADRDL